MNDIDKNIIEKIKSGEITKKPKWLFVVEHIGLWVLLGSTVLIGGAASGVIFFSLTDHDWEMYEMVGKTFFEFLIISLPYFWIILLIILSLVIYIEFKNTKTGYRYMPHFIIGGAILLSVALGGIGHFLGVGETVHELASNNIPFYEDFIYDKKDIWSHPERGLISGKITKRDEGKFELTDWNGGVWEVYTSGTIWNGVATDTMNRKIKIFGTKNEDSTFSAEEINDWKEKAQRMRK